MSKKVKWGLVAFIGLALICWGIYSQLPKTNEDLKAADEVSGKDAKEKQILNVNAKIIKPESLTDEIKISGRLLPDEEVDLTFETSGKIVEINFKEGSAVKKGQLLAKVNDRQLQAQLEGTENRISVERRNFNEAARTYNTKIRRFPGSIVAGMFGFEKRPYFEAQEGAEKAPEVKF